MGVTHDGLAVKAFKAKHGRGPARSLNLRAPDEAWIQAWMARHVMKLCRGDPEYARYYALSMTRRHERVTRLRANSKRIGR